VDEVVLVSEEEMLQAIRRLLIDEHVVAEAAGAAATAAFLKSRDHGGSSVALLVTGANISRETLEQVTGI
jgi:threo-3-hydroxy-L-aspartate ammonia-lyase